MIYAKLILNNEKAWYGYEAFFLRLAEKNKSIYEIKNSIAIHEGEFKIDVFKGALITIPPQELHRITKEEFNKVMVTALI